MRMVSFRWVKREREGQIETNSDKEREMRHRKRDTLYLLNVEYELVLLLLYEDGVIGGEPPLRSLVPRHLHRNSNKYQVIMIVIKK